MASIKKKAPAKKGTTTRVVKARVSEVSSSSNALDKLHEAIQRQTGIEGLLAPPYNPEGLARLSEGSSILPQYIDAITTNVDSFGHNFLPVFDFASPEVATLVKDAMEIEALEDAEITNTAFEEISDDAVETKLKETKRQAKVELNRLRRFFGSCCPDYSFVELRMRLRQDQLTTGNAYWEVLRDKKARPSRLVLASSVNMRLLPRDDAPTRITEWTQISDIKWVQVPQERFFRRFAEINPKTNKITVYFKEFQDPRCISRLTGEIFPDEKAFAKAKAEEKLPPNDIPASEIVHFPIPALTTPYGVPQWVGNLTAVLGSRELDEVNLAYFENKTVPPLALLVSGGRLARGVVPRLEEFIESQVKGKKNFHKILIVEAEGQKTAGGTSGIQPTMKFVPLREAQQQDGQFQQYDERNWDKLASSFRLPRILVGRDRTINRATALAAMRFGEEQVFEPIRNRFDELINRRILPELGVFFWKFRSNTPTTRDPQMLAEIIATLAETGAFTGREIRQQSQDVFNREFPEIDAPWANEPFELFLERMKAQRTKPTKTGAEKLKEASEQMEAEGAASDDDEEAETTPASAGNGSGEMEMPELS
jgi:PBSX family phage portal protein